MSRGHGGPPHHGRHHYSSYHYRHRHQAGDSQKAKRDANEAKAGKSASQEAGSRDRDSKPEADAQKDSRREQPDGKADAGEVRRAVAGGGGGRPSREQMRAAMLKRFDRDNDGKLNDEERAAARKAYEARRGGQSGNRGPRGRSPGAEQGRPDREKMRAEMLKRFDKDHDGKLNSEERSEMRKQFEAQRGGRGGPGRDGDRGQRARDARD